jgi:hypothetical protein
MIDLFNDFVHNAMDVAMSLLNGEQKIFVWMDFTPESEIAILHAVQVALILDKEICLMYKTEGEQQKINDAVKWLESLTKPLVEIFGAGRVHSYVATIPFEMLLTEMAENFDALLLVAHKSKIRELFHVLPRSGFPFLFVSAEQNPEHFYQNITVPVGYMKKSKDLALWSSYFARHNEAKVTLISANETFEEDKKTVQRNLHSIERLFRNFKFPFETIDCSTSSWKIQRKSLEHALLHQDGLLIISFSHRSSLLDRLFQITDAYVLDHSQTLSVMCINSQRDLYTFCG